MKVTLSPSDIFEIRNLSLISSKDYEYVLDLYAPIVGIKKVSVYFAMLGENKNQKKPLTSFLSKYHLSAGELEGSLSYLEAVGLISSYKNDEGFVFAVHAPRDPSQFFSHEVLFGTMKGYLSDAQVQELLKKYQIDQVPGEGYKDVSERYSDIFHLHIDGNDITDENAPGGRSAGNIELGFDKKLFAKALLNKNPYFKLDTITKDEVDRVARYSALYSFEEVAMASFVLDSFIFKNPIGKRIDFVVLSEICRKNAKYSFIKKEDTLSTSSEVRGSSASAREIRKMDNMGSVEYLSRMQKGNKPAEKDVELIETLTAEMGLPQNVVNALLFYVIGVQDYQLAKAYVTKIGGALVRAGVTNAKDTLDYLGGHTRGRTNKTSVATSTNPQNENTKAGSTSTSDEKTVELSDEEFEALF